MCLKFDTTAYETLVVKLIVSLVLLHSMIHLSKMLSNFIISTFKWQAKIKIPILFQNWFAKRFNAAVFENELKWYATEPDQGQVNYTIADNMLEYIRANQSLLEATIYSGRMPNTNHNGCVTLQDLNYSQLSISIYKV